MSRRAFVASTLASAATVQSARKPRSAFALLADIQYADKNTAGKREYRRSLEKLRECCRLLKPETCRFSIHLGDLVDEGLSSFDPVLAEFRHLPGPRYHVIGNHDCTVPRPQMMARLKLSRGYYAFSKAGLRFIVLDGMDIAVEGGWPEDSENRKEGERVLNALRESKDPNAQTWNGGIGPAQKDWLVQELARAERASRHTVLICHFPLHPASCRPAHMLWNSREIAAMVRGSTNVVACINGHDHSGGWAVEDGIAYWTLPGLVEWEPADSVYVADVIEDRLVFRRPGESDGREVFFRT